MGRKKMKYVVILGDGMPDYPIDELGGKTPLAYARTPHMDKLGRHGEVGLVRSVLPGGMPGGKIGRAQPFRDGL
jgi:2,3-bisphosphoglycerate-independent phosphoglycerate mutase